MDLSRVVSPFIRTFTGKKFNLLDPSPEDIDIRDIAHALSLINRFTGHTIKPYSVSEHCLHVSREVPPEYALQGLLHDAAEAYINDLSSPLKRQYFMAGYVEVQHTLEYAIMQRFKQDYPFHPSVTEADTRMFYTERRDLFAPSKNWEVQTDIHVKGHVHIPYAHFTIDPLSHEEAEEQYYMTFIGLGGGN